MAQPYVGEIRMFGGNFAPAGWMFCEGQLIGTTYGGDGESTFGLPDLQGRLPMHQGNNFQFAETGGVETVTLTTQQMPTHTHPLVVSTAVGSAAAPANNVLGASGSSNIYRPAPAGTPMSTQMIGPAGGSQPHENFQPYLVIDFIISLFGIFPSPT
jgi:microcystin-dependent protein